MGWVVLAVAVVGCRGVARCLVGRWVARCLVGRWVARCLVGWAVVG
ncbi:hypothetical protein [Streptomyces sp. WAC05374]|nr:hypothetical protein [Streptomyces sp. WAC05374]